MSTEQKKPLQDQRETIWESSIILFYLGHYALLILGYSELSLFALVSSNTNRTDNKDNCKDQNRETTYWDTERPEVVLLLLTLSRCLSVYVC